MKQEVCKMVFNPFGFYAFSWYLEFFCEKAMIELSKDIFCGLAPK